MTLEVMPEMLTVSQVSDFLGVSRNTIYSWCTSGQLPSLKKGNTRRIRKAVLIEWMQQLEGGQQN
jgi:excisionase family DNA binding protein